MEGTELGSIGGLRYIVPEPGPFRKIEFILHPLLGILPSFILPVLYDFWRVTIPFPTCLCCAVPNFIPHRTYSIHSVCCCIVCVSIVILVGLQ